VSEKETAGVLPFGGSAVRQTAKFWTKVLA